MTALIDSILQKRTLSLKESEVARGRLAFCDSFIFGKSGKSALQEIASHGYAKRTRRFISERLQRSLMRLRERLTARIPRVVSCLLSETFFYFF